MIAQYDSAPAVAHVEQLRREAREAALVHRTMPSLRRRIAAVLVLCVAVIDPELLRSVSDSRV